MSHYKIMTLLLISLFLFACQKEDESINIVGTPFTGDGFQGLWRTSCVRLSSPPIDSIRSMDIVLIVDNDSIESTYNFYSDQVCNIATGTLTKSEGYTITSGSSEIEGGLNVTYNFQTASIKPTADDLVTDLNDEKPCGPAINNFVKNEPQIVSDKTCTLMSEFPFSFPLPGTISFSNLLVDSDTTPPSLKLGDLKTGSGDSTDDRPEELNDDFVYINSNVNP